ncbi:maltose/maltodextrin ABC transporter substrate-binding protein MalE [Zobellella sp. An-6]|uniref:maltose/maltodextrin ABC transporter substrate-binding protein MalE n=1 Tax=Zobellella sp. An-6 TaxID=3400218 RepID=UPI004042F36D
MMKFRVKLLAGLLAGTMSGPVLAFEQDKLVIWSGSTNRGVAAVAQQFTDELGIEVVVEHPEPVTDKFQQSAANGQGPDIILWAHDRFGEWGNGGLLTPVEPSQEIRERMFDFSWDALTLNGRTWGYPLTIEAVGLIYNKDLLPEPPSSFEQLFDLKLADGVKTIMWDYNNAYFSMPLLMANGGYVFKQENGVYDARDVGVNNEGAVKGARMIKRLIDEKVMPVGADYNVMDTAFNKGELAMMINGPWAWDNLKATGINFGVAPLPTIEGQSPRSFIGVISAGINAASPNKDLAVEFIENYLLTEAGLAGLNEAVALGAVAHKAYSQVLSRDPNVAATQQIAAQGVPMPGIPETGKFWAAMNPALQNITGGQQTVEKALDDAATRMLAK